MSKLYGGNIMIYIPMLKTRREEYAILSNMVDCFSNQIIPLVEVIADKYKVRYKTNPETGEYVYRVTEKRRLKIIETPTNQDCITLSNINDILNGRKVFVEYFRFSNKVYGNNVDISRAELSWRISNNVELYKSKTKEITTYPNMIPVISIKSGFGMSKNELAMFVTDIQGKCDSMALRITEEWIDEYKGIINAQLRTNDYLLLDVLEQNPEHKFMEIEEIIDIGSKANLVLLNSPRKRETKNSDFPMHGFTNLIENSARNIAASYEINGYGDYCGLKDTMPLNDGSNGTGAALALLYDYKKNAFYSYCNHNTSLGTKGYKAVVQAIKNDQTILDPQNDCPAYNKIKTMTGNGNWSTWHNICATRYIYQTYKYL